MLKQSMVAFTTFFVLLLFISCATSPLGRKQVILMPDSQLDEMGVQAFNNVKQKTPLDTNGQDNQYVSCIANAIISVSNSPIKQWEVAVFREDATANAFALPGGKVGVYTGMFPVATTQGQLGTVVAHEIGHVLSRHGNERVSQEFLAQQGLNLVQVLSNPQSQNGQTLMGLLGVGVQYGVLLPYSRKQEREADLLGLRLMASAGFNPKESITLWQNMSRSGGEKPPEFMSTHPSDENRIKDLNNEMTNALQLYQQAQASGRRPVCSL
jgi:predicted Zn-dependent protease